MSLAQGKTYSVKEFVQKAFEILDLNYEEYLVIDKNLFRPSEVNLLLSNTSKIKNKINWRPKTSFQDLVSEMVLFDYNSLKKNNNLLNKNL